MRPLFVVEDIQPSAPRRTLFTWFGVRWNLTRWGFLFPIVYGSPGLFLALLVLPAAEPLLGRIGYGVLAGLMIVLATILHETGHMLSAGLVGGQMKELLFTATRPLTLYWDEHEPRHGVHLARALGGPMMSLLLGLTSLVMWLAAGFEGAGARLAWGTFCLTNLVYGIGSLLPVPTVDGEVIWRELTRK
jgi:Zn-dependent protease